MLNLQKNIWLKNIGGAFLLLLALAFIFIFTKPALAFENLEIQPPYKLEVFAKMPGARSIAVAPEIEALFVGTRGSTLYGWHQGRVFVLADNLHVPNGLSWRAPFLYIALQDRIVRYRFDKFTPALGKAETIFSALPDKRHHGWRYSVIDPSGKWIYVAVGVACNICATKGLEGTIIRLPVEGGDKPDIVATGIRNSVGMDFNPESGKLFFTDNGADHMGEDVPKEELNMLDAPAQFFGYPFYGGGADRTRQFASVRVPEGAVAPVAVFPAHTAPLGVHFYRGNRLKNLKGKALVALHGSWNRRVPDGYRVMLLTMAKGGRKVVKQTRLIDGFLDMKGRKGRPVDVKTFWDGRVLISDDSRGVIYALDR